MTAVLHIGVNDVPYPHDPEGTTTGQVAEILEAKYQLFGAFAYHYGPQVANALADAAAGALEDELAGGPPANTARRYAAGCSQTEDMFRRFLDADTMAALGYAGVPTAAALAGVNHRLKEKRGAPRPSFIDTGLLESSLHAWVDDQP